VLGERLAGRPEYQAYLIREARAIARVSHPHIAAVHDVLDVDGQIAIVIEHLRGETLAARLSKGPLPVEAVFTIGGQITAAVGHAHLQGVLHCDLKPANIFLTNESGVKLLDFGLARLLRRTDERSDAIGASTTLIDQRAGTPAYMSPEHRSGGPVDARSDVYSLGVTLFEMACGQRPDAPAAVDSAAETVTDVHGAPPGLPMTLRRVLDRALHLDPAERFSSAIEMDQALRAAAAEYALSKAAPPLSRKARAVLVLLAVLVAGLAATVRYTPDRSTPAAARPIVAVLPFETADTAPATHHLSGGLREAVTAVLASSPGLVVVSSASAATAATEGHDPKRIARGLGATHLLAARVVPFHDRLRIELRAFKAVEARWQPLGAVEALRTDATQNWRSVLQLLRARFARAGLTTDAESHMPSIAQASQPSLEEYARGRELLGRNDVDQAIDFFRRAVAREPSFALGHAALAEASWRKYRLTKDVTWAGQAQSSAFEALRLAPAEAGVRYSAAVVLYGTGRAKEAEEEVLHALKLQPASDEAHRLLGRIYAESGRLEQAIPEFEAAIGLRPGFAGHYRTLGLAYFDNGRFEEAIRAFAREVELNPTDGTALQALGSAYHVAGRTVEALATYKKSIDIAPSAFAYSNIGLIEYSQGRYREAVSAYERSAELGPSEPVTHRNLGDSLLKTGQRARAIRAYRRAIELADEQLRINPRDARLVSLQALCEAKTGDHAGALTRIGAALSLAPRDSEVLYHAAIVHSLNRDFPRAAAYARQAVDQGFSRALLLEDEDLGFLRNSADFNRF
jgi:tetratricopeptide (TPR) repeat protein